MSKREFIKSVAAATATVLVAGAGGKVQAAAPGPVIAVISHPVKDYAAWRVVYDSAAPIREKAGVSGAEVFHDPKDPTMIVVIHRFPTLEAAEAFLGDPGLKDAMEKGGVTAAPTVVLAVAA